MGYYRVKVVNPDGTMSLLDKTFSQVVELTSKLTEELKNSFWDKKEVDIGAGYKALFIKEV